MKIEVNYNNERSTEHSFNKSEIVIGRGKDCDLRVLADGISRKHARIFKVGEKIMIEDLGSSNGTFINNEKVVKEEFTTFFPVNLGPLISLSLMDDGVENLKTPTSKPKTYTQNLDTILNARAKTRADEKQSGSLPLPKASKTRTKTRVLKTSSTDSAFKYRILVGLLLLAGGAYYFHQGKETSSKFAVPALAKAKNAPSAKGQIQENEKNILASPPPPQELCNSEVLNALCLAFKTRSGSKYGFYEKEGIVYGLVNFQRVMKRAPSAFDSEKRLKEYIIKNLKLQIFQSLFSKSPEKIIIDFIKFSSVKNLLLRKAEIRIKDFLEENKSDFEAHFNPGESVRNSGKTFTSMEEFLKVQKNKANERPKKSKKPKDFAHLRTKLEEFIVILEF